MTNKVHLQNPPYPSFHTIALSTPFLTCDFLHAFQLVFVALNKQHRFSVGSICGKKNKRKGREKFCKKEMLNAIRNYRQIGHVRGFLGPGRAIPMPPQIGAFPRKAWTVCPTKSPLDLSKPGHHRSPFSTFKHPHTRFFRTVILYECSGPAWRHAPLFKHQSWQPGHVLPKLASSPASVVP
jgi:hypothetical protein